MPGVFLCLVMITSCFGGHEGTARNFDHADCANVIIDWIDALRFNGRDYVISTANRDVTFSTGTAVGRVQYNVAGNVCDPYYRMKDSDATFLEKGTAIFAVEGYDPELVLAAGGRIYEVRPEVGAVGRDQLPFDDGVERIRILGGFDGETEFGTVDDASLVDAFVEAALDATIDEEATTDWDYFLEFQMKDGLRFRRNYSSETGVLSGGIQLPDSAQQVIRDALK